MMAYRGLSLLLLAIALAVLAGGAVAAEDKADKDTHEGTFVSAKGETEFTMKDTDGKEHSHTLARDAKVTGPDGKECKLSDLKEGQKIRVTTKAGDKKVATKVVAQKAKE